MEEEFNVETASYKDLQVKAGELNLGNVVGVKADVLRKMIKGEPIEPEVQALPATTFEPEVKQFRVGDGFYVYDGMANIVSFHNIPDTAEVEAAKIGGFVKAV
jgi:hypothetical protein